MKILMKNICQFSKGVDQKYRDIKNINNDKKKHYWYFGKNNCFLNVKFSQKDHFICNVQ